MTQFNLHVEDVLSSATEMARSVDYECLPTEVLYGKRVRWLEQSEIAERSPRSKEEVGKILARLNFELSSPERQDAVAVLDAMALDIAANEV